jgi:hypothetical protein
VSVAPVTAAVNDCELPSGIVAAAGVTTIVTLGRIATVAEAASDGSASGVAVIWMDAGEGWTGGAVYTPVDEIDPQSTPEQPVPETVQAITWLGLEPGAKTRLAVKFAAAPAVTVAGPSTDKENRLTRLIVSEALLVGSATLTAVIVTFGGVS